MFLCQESLASRMSTKTERPPLSLKKKGEEIFVKLKLSGELLPRVQRWEGFLLDYRRLEQKKALTIDEEMKGELGVQK